MLSFTKYYSVCLHFISKLYAFHSFCKNYFLYKIPYYGILYLESYLEKTTAILWKYSFFAGLA